DVLLSSGEHLGQNDVAGVAVLELVDLNVVRPPPLFSEKVRIGLQQSDRAADLHSKRSQVLLLQQSHCVRVHTRDLLPSLDHLFRAYFVHIFAFAVSRHAGSGSQLIDISLKLLRADQLFLAPVKKIAQIFEKLPDIGRLDETLQAQLTDPLAEKN